MRRCLDVENLKNHVGLGRRSEMNLTKLQNMQYMTCYICCQTMLYSWAPRRNALHRLQVIGLLDLSLSLLSHSLLQLLSLLGSRDVIRNTSALVAWKVD